MNPLLSYWQYEKTYFLDLIFSRPEGPFLRSLGNAYKSEYEGLKSEWKFWYTRKISDRPTILYTSLH